MHKKISVVIPTYNKKKDVVEAIDSMLSQTYPVFEVIVVDNDSTDGTADELTRLIKAKSIYKKVIFVQSKENLGVTGGRNMGLSHAKGDYILFFDSDMVANKEMVSAMVECLESKKTIGIVTPKIYFWEDKNIIWSAGTDINLWTGQVLFRGGEDKGQYEKVEEVAVAPAVLLVKREVFRKIGGFDQVYFLTYEDTDFCFHAKKEGFSTYYAPSAIAYHKIPFDAEIASKRLLNRLYWVARNRIIFMKRYGRNFPIFMCFSPIFFIYYLLLSLRNRMSFTMVSYINGIYSGLIGK